MGLTAKETAWWSGSRRFRVLVSFALGASVLCAGSAWGRAINPPIGALQGPEAGGVFGEPSGVAVNSATHDVWVADPVRKAVYEFDPSGETIIATVTEAEPGKSLGEPVAVAVDGETGELCVIDAGSKAVYCFNALGTLVTSITGPETGVAFKLPTGVAVDSKTGEIWVADPGSASVYGFSASGTHEATLGGPFVEPFSVAVNSVNGEVYVGDGSTKAVYGFNALGGLVSEWKEPSPGVSFGEPAGVAVDSSTGDVYVADFRDKAAYGLSASGALVLTLTGIAEEPFQSALAMGLDSSTGKVYVGDRGTHKVYVFGALVTVPDVVTGVASEVREGSATVGGTVNPEEVPVSSCEFEYGSSSAYGQLAPCEQSPGAGGAPVEVSAVLTGLRGGVTYHYRLVAGNANGVSAGADETLFLASPAIESTSTADLTSSSVELSAVINPDGPETAYHFEYGPSAGYGTSVPVPDESIGSGTTPQTVTQHVSNLQAGTTYHFRVVAQNEDGVEVGSDHTFIYAPAESGLPDKREYEMVTPQEKAGSVVAAISFAIASDGSSLLGYSEAAFAGLTNGELAPSAPAFYRLVRTNSGWVASPATCCGLEAVSFGPGGLVWHPAEKGTGVDHLFLGEAAKGVSDGEAAKGMSDVGPVWPPGLGTQSATGIQYSVVGAASNPANGILFTIREQALVWPFDDGVVAAPSSSLYEYRGAGNGTPTLIGVTGGTGSTTLVSECGTSLGAPGVVGLEGSRYNAISEDGRRVFFTAEAGPGHAAPYLVSTCEHEGRSGTAPPADELYARCSPGACPTPNGGEEETVWVSEPDCARSSPRCRNLNTEAYSEETASAAGVLFEGAAADGSKVFFTTTQQLTSSDTDTTRDLYEYDFDAPTGERLTQISAGGTGDATPGAGAEVQGVAHLRGRVARLFRRERRADDGREQRRPGRTGRC